MPSKRHLLLLYRNTTFPTSLIPKLILPLILTWHTCQVSISVRFSLFSTNRSQYSTSLRKRRIALLSTPSFALDATLCSQLSLRSLRYSSSARTLNSSSSSSLGAIVAVGLGQPPLPHHQGASPRRRSRRSSFSSSNRAAPTSSSALQQRQKKQQRQSTTAAARSTRTAAATSQL